MNLEVLIAIVFLVAAAIPVLFRKALAKRAFKKAMIRSSAARPSCFATLVDFPRVVPCSKETEICCLSLEKFFPAENLAQNFADSFVRRFPQSQSGAKLMKCARHLDARNGPDDEYSLVGDMKRGARPDARNRVDVVLAVKEIKSEDRSAAIAAVVVVDWASTVTISVRWSRWSASQYDKGERTLFRELRASQSSGAEKDPLDEIGRSAEQLAKIALQSVLDAVADIRADLGEGRKRELRVGRKPRA